MISRLFPALALFLSVFCCGAAPWKALGDNSGRLQIESKGVQVCQITPGLYADGWRGAQTKPNYRGEVKADGSRESRITSGGTTVLCTSSARLVDGALALRYVLKAEGEISLNSLHVALSMPDAALRNAGYTINGKSHPFPPKYKETHLWNDVPKTAVRLDYAGGDWLEIKSGNDCPLLLQDNRQWGPTFVLRFGPQMVPAKAWKAGESLEVDLLLTCRDGFSLTEDKPVTIQANEDWIPLEVDLDIVPGSALDFSKLRATDAPAGVHGAVIATKDGHFAFADSPTVPRRFYGVNFCGTAQYISHEEADKLADRLMRIGYNAVRFHHHESHLLDRSGGTSTVLNKESLDRIDYLFAALKKRGIYMTTDTFVSRPVYAREIWPGAEGRAEMNEIKMALPVNQNAFENWKTFIRNFLGHRNPYTGNIWAQDPALAWISMINEGNFGNYIRRLSDRCRADWERAWGGWLKKRYGTVAAIEKAWGEKVAGELETPKVALPNKGGTQQKQDFALFEGEMERDVFLRMRKFLREELGCTALFTNMNAWTNTPYSQLARSEFDYVDDHFYIDHPQFLEKRWRLPSKCSNRSPVLAGAPGGRGVAFTRLFNKPFTVSEYNYSGPGRFRGVGGILTGCMGAVQDWSVIWRFAYSHSSSRLFKVASANYFDIASDPLNLAAERASLCLFLRGDLAPAPRAAAITFSPETLGKAEVAVTRLSPSWSSLVSTIRVGTYVGAKNAVVPADISLPVDGAAPRGGVVVKEPYGSEAGAAITRELRAKNWLDGKNQTDLEQKRTQSANNQFLMDGLKDMMVLDTECTAGGYARAGRTIQTAVVDISIEETGATVWISSLDGAAIGDSRHLLLTHLTDQQNTGAEYAEKARQILLKHGGLPHLVRDGAATVTLKQKASGKLRMFNLSTAGKRLAEVPVSGNQLALRVSGAKSARMIYEIVIEE